MTNVITSRWNAMEPRLEERRDEDAEGADAGITAELDTVYADLPSGLHPAVRRAQARSIGPDLWEWEIPVRNEACVRHGLAFVQAGRPTQPFWTGRIRC